MLVTDSELNRAGRRRRRRHQAARPRRWSRWATSSATMHTSSGLLDELDGGVDAGRGRAGRCSTTSASSCPRRGKAPLGGQHGRRPTAGSSRATCRSSTTTCTTGSIDVRSIKELARRWYPRVYFDSPEKHGGHRALADIRESIEELRVLPRGGVRAPARPGHRRGPGAGRASGRHSRRRAVTSDRPGPEPVTMALSVASGARRRSRGMVGVAQLVEHLVVVQVAAGSSPVTHPRAGAGRPCAVGRPSRRRRTLPRIHVTTGARFTRAPVVTHQSPSVAVSRRQGRAVPAGRPAARAPRRRGPR